MNARLAAALLAPLAAATLAHAAAVTQVDVVKQGAVYVVDAVLVTPVSLPQAWAVLSDFDAMTHFVPNLTESRVTARDGNRWTVKQKGVMRLGPFELEFESVRELELTPYEKVVARQIRGAARSAQSETRLAPADGATRISYHAEVEPAVWLPAVISRRLIEREVRAQFEAIAREMLRRRAQAAAAPPLEARIPERR